MPNSEFKFLNNGLFGYMSHESVKYFDSVKIENKDDFEDTPNYLPSNSGYWEEWLVDLGIIEDNYSDEED